MGLVKIFKGKLNIFFPIALVVLCFLLIFTRIPFFDEANAYLISKFSLNELFQITRFEGHPLIWFLILKLFSWTNFYPQAIFFPTCIISICLILFFWRKAPFSCFIKVLILLSFPFLGYFLIVARPYGLTILLLFLTIHCFKKQIWVLFSLFLAILANVTIMGTIGAISFLVLFIKKIFQEKIDKKVLFFSVLIVFFGFLTLFLQLYNPQIPNKIGEFDTLLKKNLIYYFIFPFKDFHLKTLAQNLFQVSSFALFYASLFLFFKKEKNAFIFLFLSFLFLTLLFLYIYTGAIWHYFFYFIFFIASLWICWDKIEKNKIYKYFLVLFFILMVNPVFYIDRGIDVLNESEKYKFILDRIILDNELKNSKLFCFEKNSYIAPSLIPYLEKKQIFLHDINGYKRGSFDSYLKTYSKKDNKNKIDSFALKIDKNRNNYLLVNNLSDINIPYDVVLKSKKYKIILKLIDKIDECIFAIYKIEVAEID